jgi:glycosyltransferase involved in cell wall biosynthesis
MKIGIDAKWYYSGPPSGVNVVRNIVDNLIKNNNEDEILFFLSNKDIHLIEDFKKKINNKKNISFKFITGKVNIITNMIIFPFYFYRKGLDAILFQNYVPIWGGYKTKYVNYVHDFLFLDYPQYFTKIEKIVFQLMIRSVKKAKHTITISQSEKDRIIEHSKISPGRISYVYHGLDAMFYERSDDNKANIIKKYNLPKKYILYVGRINIRKNLKTLIESFSLIKQNIELVIVGKEDNHGLNIDNEIKKLRIENKVHKIGHLPDNDLAEIYSAATLFVFPSYAEGFGLPPLEAMKSGVPTIVSNSTSLPEACGDAALYFDANNKFELASKIDFMLTNPDAYNDYKMKGIKKSNEFSWDKSVSNILAILYKSRN